MFSSLRRTLGSARKAYNANPGRYHQIAKNAGTALISAKRKAYQMRDIYQNRPSKRRGQAHSSENANAEMSIGYGNHDAKVIYSRNKRRSRKTLYKRGKKRQVKRSLGKSQKKLVRSIARKTLNVNYPVSTTLMVMQKEMICAENGQSSTYFGTGTGYSFPLEATCDLNQIFLQNYTSSNYSDMTKNEQLQVGMELSKIYFNDVESEYTIFNNHSQIVELKVFTFECKKSIKYSELVADQVDTGTFADVVSDPATVITSWSQLLQNGELDDEEKDPDTFVEQLIWSRVGWKPTDTSFAKKWLSCIKIERFELGTGSQMIIDDYQKIGLTLQMKTASNYAAIKNLTRFKIFTVVTNPVRIGGTDKYSQAITANSGVVVQQRKRYHWRPVCNTAETLSTTEKKKHATTLSCKYGQHNTTRLDIGTVA